MKKVLFGILIVLSIVTAISIVYEFINYLTSSASFPIGILSLIFIPITLIYIIVLYIIYGISSKIKKDIENEKKVKEYKLIKPLVIIIIAILVIVTTYSLIMFCISLIKTIINSNLSVNFILERALHTIIRDYLYLIALVPLSIFSIKMIIKQKEITHSKRIFIVISTYFLIALFWLILFIRTVNFLNNPTPFNDFIRTFLIYTLVISLGLIIIVYSYKEKFAAMQLHIE